MPSFRTAFTPPLNHGCMSLMWRMFEAGGEYSVTDFVEKFGVSEDTVSRDLATLQDAPIRLPLVRVVKVRWRMMGKEE